MALRTGRELFYGWLLATLLSGIPSTVYALLTGADPLEPPRAAAAMLLRAESEGWRMFAAATVVHFAVSLFWAIVLWRLLPARHTMLWALAASFAIALIDLRLIAPAFFPEVAALDFWPQVADHLMWGACFGAPLAYRTQRTSPRVPPSSGNASAAG
jgi:hypothetical protein